MSTTNNRLQISAAVLLLLAGCGGGGGGSEAPKAVSASPSATTTTTATNAAANTAAQRTAEQAASQAASQANVARNAANQAAAALQAAQAAAQEANAKRAEAEAANKRAADAEAALQKATAERRAAEEALAKAAREEAARKQAEAAAAAKAKEEAEAKAKAEAEAAAKAKEEADAKAKAEEEAKAKAEEAARRQAAAQNTVPASSNDGVSGLLLATLLDQAMTTSRAQQNDAEALPAESVTGEFLEDADAPTVNAAQYTDPSNYVAGGQRLLGNYQPANGEYHYHLFNGGVVKAGKDAAFKMNTVGIKLKVEATADKVELDNELKASDAIGETSIEAAPTFSSGEDLSFQKSTLVSRAANAGVIQTWYGPNSQSIQLMLAESSESGATLCWNYNLTKTSRLYCNRWQIPAGWKAGQPLSFQGYYIHETRTVDGANKNYYWHTR